MTQLPNPFLNPSVISPRTERYPAAAASPGKGDAAAEPISVSPGAGNSSLPSGESEPSVMLAWASGENLPSSNEGRPEEASASAPTKNPDADALGKCDCAYSHCDDFDRPDCKAKAAGLDPWPDGATDHIHEIFFYVRKLMKRPPRFVLDQDRFLAEIEETPLFVREGDHLRRWSA